MKCCGRRAIPMALRPPLSIKQAGATAKLCIIARARPAEVPEPLITASRSDRSANNGLNDRPCLYVVCVVWIAAGPNDAVTGAQRISTENLVPAKNIVGAHYCLNLQVCNIRKWVQTWD
ncbi:hypothetical protein THAOC_18765 [Thalassiosira oceanica]|uniref:Uncharacterized protein n=1 Tax=Thalassiosira oceanica TaxID=159749 RepID=K0SR72_THAOC|nr:hypothetical protein THAOC_18765 [Thalassiosira oceanica]|eukprot:EJK60822.1 hypothetical protein THAOC_18765 [Thalassiosira oceanica]